jgi:hypothetical protein
VVIVSLNVRDSILLQPLLVVCRRPGADGKGGELCSVLVNNLRRDVGGVQNELLHALVALTGKLPR